MDTKGIILGSILVALIFLIKWVFFILKTPPSKTFKWARCSKISTHSKRTVDAWRKGFAKIYCSSCHQLWIQSHPKIERTHLSSGCLSIVVLAVILPYAVFILLK